MDDCYSSPCPIETPLNIEIPSPSSFVHQLVMDSKRLSTDKGQSDTIRDYAGECADFLDVLRIAKAMPLPAPNLSPGRVQISDKSAALLEQKFSIKCSIEDIEEEFFGKPSFQSRLRRLSQSKARKAFGLLKRFRNLWKQRSHS